jgi:hypothetical protein
MCAGRRQQEQRDALPYRQPFKKAFFTQIEKIYRFERIKRYDKPFPDRIYQHDNIPFE